ncbi:hypothetical protein ARMGADRAFT_679031, partial [Armillaria gallica]
GRLGGRGAQGVLARHSTGIHTGVLLCTVPVLSDRWARWCAHNHGCEHRCHSIPVSLIIEASTPFLHNKTRVRMCLQCQRHLISEYRLRVERPTQHRRSPIDSSSYPLSKQHSSICITFRR